MQMSWYRCGSVTSSEAIISARMGTTDVKADVPYMMQGIRTAFHCLTNPAVAKAKNGTWNSSSRQIKDANHGAVGLAMK